MSQSIVPNLVHGWRTFPCTQFTSFTPLPPILWLVKRKQWAFKPHGSDIKSIELNFVVLSNFRTTADGQTNHSRKWTALWLFSNTFSRWSNVTHRISRQSWQCQKPRTRASGSMSICDNSAWNWMDWLCVCSRSAFQLPVPRWRPLNSGYFCVQHTKRPKSVRLLTIHVTHWTALPASWIATNTFQAG